MSDNKTDISTISDLQTLKALAYDAIAAKEQAEQDLRIINTRIAELMNLAPAIDTLPAVRNLDSSPRHKT